MADLTHPWWSPATRRPERHRTGLLPQAVLRRSGRLATLVVLTAPLLLACTPAEQPAAVAASRAFTQAVGAGDTAGACALLSDEARGNLEAISTRPCVESLARLALPADPPQSVEVWGDNAQVRTSSDVLFLSRFSSGWRVTAVGCRPRPDQPYDCALEG